MLAFLRYLRYLQFAHLSKPISERAVYRLMRKLRAKRIVEMGVGTLERTQRMLALAKHWHTPAEIHYTGIDQFELRTPSDAPGVALKEAHRQLAPTGCKIRLVPGDPMAALVRTANSLGTVDLVLISADQDRRALERAWLYVPRMLHPQSIVLIEEAAAEGGTVFRTMPADEIQQLAGAQTRRRAA
jgi:hypothetical protein